MRDGSLASLMRRYHASGDAAAIEELVRRTRPRLIRVARRIGAPQDAEDTVQAAFLALARRRGEPFDAPVLPWLIRTVIRLAYRRKAAEKRQVDLARRLAKEAPDSSLLAAAADAERHEALHRGLAALPRRYRDAIVLHHLEGLTVSETAQLLGVPEATARTRIRRGRALLQSAIARFGRGAALAVFGLFDDVAKAGGALLMKKQVAVVVVLLLATVAGVGFRMSSGRATGASRRAERPEERSTPTPGDATAETAPDAAAEGTPARGARVLVVERGTGKAVPWSTVRVFSGWEKVAEAVTDADGIARIAGLASPGDYLVDALPPGQVQQEDRRPPLGRRHPLPEEGDLTLEIDPARAIVWRVLDGDIPPPADGTVIRLARDPGALVTPPPQGVMRGGFLVTSGWPAMAAHAFAYGPGDTAGTLFAAIDAPEGRAFAFRRTTNLTLVLRRADGTPAEAYAVTLLGPGNLAHVQATTDREGTVRIEGLRGALANIQVRANAEDQPRWLGSIDLGRGGELRIVRTLEAPRPIELVVRVEDAAGLPEGVRVQIPGILFRDRRDDPPACTVRCAADLPPGITSLHVVVDAPGFIPQEAALPVGPKATPVLGAFRLVRGLELKVVLSGAPPPAGAGLDPLDLLCHADTDARYIGELSEEKTAYDGLAPGSYEVRARGTGVTIAEVVLLSGADPPTLTIDRSRFGIVRGRVALPPGYDPAHARVVVEEVPDAAWLGARVNPRDGTFVISVPGDRPVTIRAVHPLLSPDPAHGRATTTSGADGVVLRMVEGPRLRFRIPAFFRDMPEDRRDDLGWRRPEIRVILFRDGKAIRELAALASHVEWVAAGFEPGRYTAWIDVPDGTPVEREMTLGSGDTDLGELPQEQGSRLRVHVLVSEPLHPPRIRVGAARRGQPALIRQTSSQGEEEVAVPGLPAGVYDVTLSVYTGGAIHPNFDLRTVEADGSGDVDLTYDLRDG